MICCLAYASWLWILLSIGFVHALSSTARTDLWTAAIRDQAEEELSLLVLHESRGSLASSPYLAMDSALHQPAIKLVGSNGQISLGKQFAGRHVLVEESEPGVWIVRTATVIPDNERWLHEPAAAASLQAAMAWSASHPPVDADLDQTLTRLGGDKA